MIKYYHYIPPSDEHSIKSVGMHKVDGGAVYYWSPRSKEWVLCSYSSQELFSSAYNRKYLVEISEEEAERLKKEWSNGQ